MRRITVNLPDELGLWLDHIPGKSSTLIVRLLEGIRDDDPQMILDTIAHGLKGYRTHCAQPGRTRGSALKPRPALAPPEPPPFIL